MVGRDRLFGVIGGKMGRIKHSEKEFSQFDGRLLAARIFQDGVPVPVSGASSSVVKKNEVEYRNLQRAHDERSDDELIEGTDIILC